MPMTDATMAGLASDKLAQGQGRIYDFATTIQYQTQIRDRFLYNSESILLE